MDNRPVCIFDSGFGGLTAVRAIKQRMPEENIVFFADTGRVPYGGRPVEQLRTIAAQDIKTVLAYDPKLIIAACGTVSSTASDVLDSAPVPTFGVLRPSIDRMAAIPGRNPLGIIATEASIRSGAFERALRAKTKDREIVPIGCPDFVNLIESGHVSPEDPELMEAVKTYLRPMKEKRIDGLLLGCTHYGLISEAIREYLGTGVVLVEASACAAESAEKYLTGNGLRGGSGKEKFLTSGMPDAFTRSAALLLGRPAGTAEYIPPKAL